MSLNSPFTRRVGALGGGNDLKVGEFTLEQAHAIAASLRPHGCVGFTFSGPAAKFAYPYKRTIHFKSSYKCNSDPN